MSDTGRRLRRLEAKTQVNMILVTADPNGSVSAAIGTLAFDTTGQQLYVNDDGATSWTLIGP